MAEINTENFEQEMKDLVMSFFPDAEFIPLVLPIKEGKTKQELQIVDCYNFYTYHESDEKELVLKYINMDVKTLRFFKPASHVFWRSCEFNAGYLLSSDEAIYKAWVRFSLGYLI